MAPSNRPAVSQRFGWVLALVAVAFLLGIWLGRGPDEERRGDVPDPAPSVEIRIDAGAVTLLPDASLRFDIEPKEIGDFASRPHSDSGGHSTVDSHAEKR